MRVYVFFFVCLHVLVCVCGKIRQRGRKQEGSKVGDGKNMLDIRKKQSISKNR